VTVHALVSELKKFVTGSAGGVVIVEPVAQIGSGQATRGHSGLSGGTQI
jgi:hypothetical protein